MGLSAIGSTSTSLPLTAATATANATATAVGGGFITQMPGAQMAQPGGGVSILKKMLVGGVAGAVAGAGIGFVTTLPFMAFLPPFLAIGPAMGGLIGGVAGAALGLIKGLKDNNSQNLGLQAASAAGTAPVNIPRPLAGKTYNLGATGATIKWTQRALKNVGVYAGKVTGKLDAKTASAIKKYEVMKGALPTGSSSPDLRAALSQDVRLSRQYI